MSETKFYTDRSNAKRAAEAMLRAGKAPALDYGIKGYTEGEHAGKFEIVWRMGDRAEAEAEAPQAASLAAANGAGMPEKPVITSATNQTYQKRLDELLELAAKGDWDDVEAYEVKGQNTYAKMVIRYRDALLAAHRAAA